MSEAGQGTSVTYDVEEIFGDHIEVVNDRPFAAGTYVKGEIVAYNTSTNKYVTFVAAGANGTGTAAFIVPKDITLASDGNAGICSGEFQKANIVALMAGLSTPVTVTDLMLHELDKNGCYLKDR